MPKIVKDEEIFAAVMQVISEYGYAGATTKQMAMAANVSEVTLFRKFGTKINLIKQAVSMLVEQSEFLNQIKYTSDIHVDLLQIVRAYQESAVKHGQFIFIMLAEMSLYPELETLLEMPFGIFAQIGRLLQQYQDAGVLKLEHPMHAMAALFGPLIYIGMLRKAMPQAAVPPIDFEQHVTHFLEGRRV